MPARPNWPRYTPARSTTNPTTAAPTTAVTSWAPTTAPKANMTAPPQLTAKKVRALDKGGPLKSPMISSPDTAKTPSRLAAPRCSTASSTSRTTGSTMATRIPLATSGSDMIGSLAARTPVVRSKGTDPRRGTETSRLTP